MAGAAMVGEEVVAVGVMAAAGVAATVRSYVFPYAQKETCMRTPHHITHDPSLTHHRPDDHSNHPCRRRRRRPPTGGGVRAGARVGLGGAGALGGEEHRREAAGACVLDCVCPCVCMGERDDSMRACVRASSLNHHHHYHKSSSLRTRVHMRRIHPPSSHPPSTTTHHYQYRPSPWRTSKRTRSSCPSAPPSAPAGRRPSSSPITSSASCVVVSYMRLCLSVYAHMYGHMYMHAPLPFLKHHTHCTGRR